MVVSKLHTHKTEPLLRQFKYDGDVDFVLQVLDRWITCHT